jgi:hypothetical protein
MLPKGADEGGDADSVVLTFTTEDWMTVEEALLKLLEELGIEADIS